jgi:hypothetical protein
LNRVAPADGWSWEKCGEADFRTVANFLEIGIPRSVLSLNGKLDVEFKWSDNMQRDGDVMDFYLSGDVAPVGRFNFIYREN